MTTPILFAQSRGEPHSPGPHQCFYCGGSCDDDRTTARYVAESFTERNAVACPASPFVCGGCVACLRSDVASVPLIDGTTQRPKEGKRPTLQVRWFSWIVKRESALAATPAHREHLLAACLSPPEPPYAICIADGNKHQLYKTPVNHSRERIAVNCEGERVEYHPQQLLERLNLVMALVAVCGKGGNSVTRLMDPSCDMGVTLQLANHYGDADALHAEWRATRNQPLSSLALWLCPGKEECLERLSAPAP